MKFQPFRGRFKPRQQTGLHRLEVMDCLKDHLNLDTSYFQKYVMSDQR